MKLLPDMVMIATCSTDESAGQTMMRWVSTQRIGGLILVMVILLVTHGSSWAETLSDPDTGASFRPQSRIEASGVMRRYAEARIVVNALPSVAEIKAVLDALQQEYQVLFEQEMDRLYPGLREANAQARSMMHAHFSPDGSSGETVQQVERRRQLRSMAVQNPAMVEIAQERREAIERARETERRYQDLLYQIIRSLESESLESSPDKNGL